MSIGTILPQYYKIMRNIVVLTLFITLWWTAEVCLPIRSRPSTQHGAMIPCVSVGSNRSRTNSSNLQIPVSRDFNPHGYVSGGVSICLHSVYRFLG